MQTISRNKIVIAVVSVVVVAGLAYLTFGVRPAGSWKCENGAWRKVGNPRGLPPELGCPAVVTAPAPAPNCEGMVAKNAAADAAYLSKGSLGRHEPCMKGDAWYLKYTTPAGPRLIEIAFEANASCAVNEQVAQCDKMNPPSGSKTSAMSGRPDGAYLRLSTLKFSTK